jgi:hypothetical protein
MFKFAWTLFVFFSVFVAVTVGIGWFTNLSTLLCVVFGLVAAIWAGSRT